MKKVYGYIRVSTVKQGSGVSLQEQKEAIIRYAEKHQLNIIQFFEEQETAAKQGRPLFNKMIKLVRDGKSNGVIIHKIDRSARNLKDWALLGDLIDQGFDIHFAHESLDMETRGGRLAADIQAVIASDYIRNLRDEAVKGLYGRLKQGVYPFGAPIGYVNTGRGQLKTIDKLQGPLVHKAFQLYATGKYNLEGLTEVMQKFGLRNTKGNVVPMNRISTMLNNPYYTGVMRVKGKTFPGNHDPLVSPKLFMEVQNILQGKTNSRIIKHDFLFRRLIKCADCNYSLIGEKQKGHVYYRCHSKNCITKGIREETVEKALINSFEPIQFHPKENQVLNELLEEAQNNWTETQSGIEGSLKMQQGRITQKMERLTDAYIENVIDKNMFEDKKEHLLVEMQGLQNKTAELEGQKEAIFRKAKLFLELIKSVKKSYLSGILEEKRKIMKSVTSNLSIQGKKLMITMKSPFQELANRSDFLGCALNRNTPRTCTPEIADTANYTSVPVDNPELREQMKELLEMILRSFELQEDNEEEESYDI